jgi:hypothetical protein
MIMIPDTPGKPPIPVQEERGRFKVDQPVTLPARLTALKFFTMLLSLLTNTEPIPMAMIFVSVNPENVLTVP